MCTIICTVRSVLWYITSIAGTLLILLALFSNKWLVGHVSPTSFNNIGMYIYFKYEQLLAAAVLLLGMTILCIFTNHFPTKCVSFFTIFP